MNTYVCSSNAVTMYLFTCSPLLTGLSNRLNGLPAEMAVQPRLIVGLFTYMYIYRQHLGFYLFLVSHILYVLMYIYIYIYMYIPGDNLAGWLLVDVLAFKKNRFQKTRLASFLFRSVIPHIVVWGFCF